MFLLTGFLGSGKTTLLNRALKEPALANTAVVVNELGEIGLDQAVIAQATDNVVLLDAGCLCCANTGALHETLADLDGRRARGEIPPFERVIIETSGAADPAPLLNVLLGHPLVTGAYAFEATVCAIDAQHFLASRTEYPELDKQVAIAERFYVTKRDLADPRPVLDFLQDAEILKRRLSSSPPTKGRGNTRSRSSARSARARRIFPAFARMLSAPLRRSPGRDGRRGRGSPARNSARGSSASKAFFRSKKPSRSCRACRACSTRRSASATGRMPTTATAWSASRATSRKKTSRSRCRRSTRRPARRPSIQCRN